MDGRIERASAPGMATKLRAHAAFGYRFDSSGLLLRVAREVLALPVPYDAEQAS
jgi:hypothetical protein